MGMLAEGQARKTPRKNRSNHLDCRQGICENTSGQGTAFTRGPLQPPPAPMISDHVHESPSWELTRRNDGAVVVRVHSSKNNGHTLPDAVFAFRRGDPQFAYWDAQLRAREKAASS